MKRTSASLALLFCTALLGGCVERRFIIETSIPGVPQDGQAQVLRNGQPLGFTPVDDAFVYYGKYHFTLFKDGYETLHVEERVRTPWYEIPGIDFIVENLIPWTIHDVRRLRYTMQPAQAVRSEDVLGRATPLREQGRLIGDQPAPPRPPPVAEVPAPAPSRPPG